MSDTTPPCILCGTMNDIYDDDAHTWRCDCGATSGVMFHRLGKLDLTKEEEQ